MESNVRVNIDAIDQSKGAFASLKASIGDVKKSVEKVKYDLSSTREGFQQLAIAGGAAFTAIGFASFKAIKAASNLNESVNAVNVVFGEGADQVLKFGENSAKAVGLSTAAFNQMATVTGALLKDTGIGMSAVADQTNELTVRAADMASVFNTDVSDAMSAINQAIRGETEAIRRYAGDVTDATLQNYLYSQGIQTNVTDLTEQEKRLYRVDLIMAQTAVTAGDFKNTSEGLANQQRILSAEIENLSATLGAQLSPILLSVFDALRPVLEQVGHWIEQNPELARNLILVAGAVTGLIAVIAALGLAILAFNPIAAAIVLAIVGIGAVVYSVRNAMQEIGITWADIWEGIKIATLIAIDAMLGPLDEIVRAVAKAVAALGKLPGVKLGVSITKKAFSSVSDLFRADGGPVAAGQGYIVGERGPEYFTPNTNGNIIPNHALAGGGNIIVNNYFSGTFLDDRGAARRMSGYIMDDLKTQARL